MPPKNITYYHHQLIESLLSTLTTASDVKAAANVDLTFKVNGQEMAEASSSTH